MADINKDKLKRANVTHTPPRQNTLALPKCPAVRDAHHLCVLLVRRQYRLRHGTSNRFSRAHCKLMQTASPARRWRASSPPFFANFSPPAGAREHRAKVLCFCPIMFAPPPPPLLLLLAFLFQTTQMNTYLKHFCRDVCNMYISYACIYNFPSFLNSKRIFFSTKVSNYPVRIKYGFNMLNIHNSIHKSIFCMSIEHLSAMNFMYCMWLKGILKPFKKHNCSNKYSLGLI